MVTIRSLDNGMFRITKVLLDEPMLDVTLEDDALETWRAETSVSVRSNATARTGSARWNGNFVIYVERRDGSEFSLPVKVGVAKIRTFYGGTESEELGKLIPNIRLVAKTLARPRGRA